MSTATVHTWQAVTKREPCVICGSDHWCARTIDADLARCMRGGETPAGWRFIRANADGGKLYGRVSFASPPPARKRAPAPPAAPARDWTAEQSRYRRASTYQREEALAYELGVTIESLRAVGIGWADGATLKRLEACGADWYPDYPDGAYSFPEYDGAGKLIGLTFRALDGRKGGPKGGHRGLTIPDTFSRDSADPLLIVEGATDVAACCTLGISAIGRPSNVGGVAHLGHLLRDYAGELFVVGERDQHENGTWPGKEGAESVARALADRLGRAVKWTLPPAGSKDMRSWLSDHDAHLIEDLRESLL